jgi:uncharacterized SAM-binding protein YcdF (DUF218 family)
MFFTISKVVWFVVNPTNLLIFLSLAGCMLLAAGLRRVGLWAATTGAVGLLVLGGSPAPNLLMRSLEDRFAQVINPGQVDGVIVLGGAIGESRGRIKMNEAASRMTEAMALARRYPQARIVFTGGEGSLVGSDGNEADATRTLFRQMGLEGERFIYENASRNTRENAVFTRDRVEPKPGERWLLLTSAYHMPRAVGCFQAVGFPVIPYPVDYYSDGDMRDLWQVPRSFANGLRMSETAIKEWVGLIVYRLQGYTPSVLPH